MSARTPLYEKTSAEQRRLMVVAVGKTLAGFAKRCGLTEPTVHQFLQGGAVNPETAEKIAGAIEASGWRFADGGVVRARP